MRSAAIRFAAILALAAASMPALAAPPAQFESIGIGGGGGLYTPAVSYDPNLVMISCDMGGVYVSRDGAVTWKMIDYRQLSNANRCMPLFDPSDRLTIYAASGNVLKITSNGGDTWRPAIAGEAPWKGETITHLAFSEMRRTLFVGTEGGLYYSDDDGVHWRVVRRLVGVCGGVVPITTSVYAASGDKVYRSIDGGSLWESLNAPTEDKRVLSFTGAISKTNSVILLAVIEGKGLVGSDDMGRTWTTLIDDPDLRQVAMAPHQNAVAYAAGRSDVYRTTNGGARWDKCFRMEDPGKNVSPSWVQTELKWGYSISPSGLGVCPSSPQTVMIATQGDAYISSNAGGTWRPVVNTALGPVVSEGGNGYRSVGLEATSAWQYLFNPWKPRINYIAYTDIGFVRGPSRWRLWIPSTKGSPWGNTFYQVVFDPFTRGRMYAAASNQHDIPHWTQIDHVANSGGVAVSEDHGANWARCGEGLPEKPCTSICVDPASKEGAVTMYVTLYGDGVYKTTDGGKTWARKSDGLSRNGNNHVFMVKVQPGTGRVYCSVTGAREGSAFPLTGGLYVSEDGGEYWNELTPDVGLHWVGGFDFDPRDSNVIYLTASTIPGSNEGGLYKTTDGGATWTRLLKDEDFTSAGGPGYVQSMFVSVAPHNPDLVYFSTVAQGLWLSRDAGKTWAQIEGIPFASISRVCFPPLDTSTIYVTTFGGGVWRGPAVPGVPMRPSEETSENE